MSVAAEPLGPRGLLLVTGSRAADPRGSFTKHAVLEVLRDAGAEVAVAEVVSARNSVAGTLRGLHYQVPPYAESKLLWPSRGAIFDVLVDLRPDEPTYGGVTAVELSEGSALYVPEGMAHGYQTLVDDTEVVYLIGAGYEPSAARTLAYDDPTLGIAWPLPVTGISDKDRAGHPWPQ